MALEELNSRIKVANKEDVQLVQKERENTRLMRKAKESARLKIKQIAEHDE